MNDPLSSAASAALNPGSSKQQPSLMQALSAWLRHALKKHDGSLKEVLEEVIEEHQDDGEHKMPAAERAMLQNMLSFSDIKVIDIMIPRMDIAAVPHDISMDDFKKHIREQRHTRIPVYEDTLDNLLGFVHVKDLLVTLCGDETFDMTSYIRELLFVPPSMRIIDLLLQMRRAGGHMAIVVDEYGGTDGLVTLEDLFEEIVGDIQDEHDEDEAQEEIITRISDRQMEVSARIPIDKLEEELGVKLVSEQMQEDFDTLGGLIFCLLGRIPVKGERITHTDGLTFEILEADPRRINKVLIQA